MTLVKVPFDCACLPLQAYDVNILYKCLCVKSVGKMMHV